MAAAALDNANPTILSASQLPTRQKRSAPRNGPDCRYSDLIFAKPSYLSRPFLQDDDIRYQDDTAAAVPWSRLGAGSGAADEDRLSAEPIDEQEIYDLISNITDPEHPVSLGQLSVVNLPDIHITPSPALGVPSPNTIVHVTVELTPTVTHCSLATVLGLGVRVRLEQVLPPNYRVEVICKENSHSQDDQVNKQLSDKERVAAALENDSLRSVLDKMLESCIEN
ncbi:MIP18 family protein [Trichoderma ghanense]|uniref:FAM96B-like protein n=2 Tax=Trichoderma TaxID=5543 RepID=A0A024S649_HYPJR|nr:FAM96B-like protein [Trichoderma reesei RUT C-30]